MTVITATPTRPSPTRPRWYQWGLGGIFLLSLGLRFWGLERFNTLVFDEIYYAKFGDNYLTQTPFFDGHPPLSKYIVALGMWLGDRLPIGPAVANDLSGSWHRTWSYRWTAALMGAFLPVIVAELVRLISHNRRFAIIASFLVAMDGLFLVESRYALNNVYLVGFGLLGQIFLLKSVAHRALGNWLCLSLSGAFFAASAAIKWNGLWFLLGTYGWLGLAWTVRLWQRLQPANANDANAKFDRNLLDDCAAIHPIAIALCLGILPVLIYSAIWIPHLQLNDTTTFWELQQQILTYHQGVKSGKEVHPYCSSWDSWLLMRQPVAYFYKVGIDPTRMIAPEGISLPTGPIYAVHAMGNPMLWWSATAAIIATGAIALGELWQRFWQWISQTQSDSAIDWTSILSHQQVGIASFLLINYAANLLPWMRVSRCIFIYHYMGASIFSMVALAWWCDRLWQSPAARMIVATLLSTIILAFTFWLPVYVGWPLSQPEYNSRMWSQAWICGANCPSPPPQDPAI
jgi:dolichyl-phosphate-mannose-protein mannosyltransferase